ncbi:hypothetical protein X975_09864, partial [Stegodyphus mimosarum]
MAHQNLIGYKLILVFCNHESFPWQFHSQYQIKLEKDADTFPALKNV